MFTVPTLPLDASCVAPFALPQQMSLEPGLKSGQNYLLEINLSLFCMPSFCISARSAYGIIGTDDLHGLRLTEGTTMLRISLMAATTLFISACAGIAHDTPEAQQQIKQDLHLATIIDSSRMNWCVHPYGSAPGCKPEKGVGIVTPDGLLMAHFVSGKYVLARVLKSEDVICSAVPGGASANGYFFAFANSVAYMLGPLKSDRDEINTRFKANMFYSLHSRGQHSYSGSEVNFQRPTGEKIKQITFIPVGLSSITRTEMIDVLEIHNPCAGDI